MSSRTTSSKSHVHKSMLQKKHNMILTERDEVLNLWLRDPILRGSGVGQAVSHHQVSVPLLELLKQQRNAVSHILCQIRVSRKLNNSYLYLLLSLYIHHRLLTLGYCSFSTSELQQPRVCRKEVENKIPTHLESSDSGNCLLFCYYPSTIYWWPSKPSYVEKS